MKHRVLSVVVAVALSPHTASAATPTKDPVLTVTKSAHVTDARSAPTSGRAAVTMRPQPLAPPRHHPAPTSVDGLAPVFDWLAGAAGALTLTGIYVAVRRTRGRRGGRAGAGPPHDLHPTSRTQAV